MDELLYVLFGALIVAAFAWGRSRYSGFLAQRPEDYTNGKPKMDIRKHLNGHLICEGVIYGPMGRVTSRFVGNFDCQWHGDAGTMSEVFNYDDGSVQTRQWEMTITETGNISARADDVVGLADGVQLGSAVRLKYKFRLPEASGGHVLDTVDWMYLTPNGTIVNRSQFRKFGVKVAELVATLRPVDEEFEERT